ncbi:MAG: peptide-methionine (S)-S-oxide reductase MsrA [Hyphomicrobiales bacterium]
MKNILAALVIPLLLGFAAPAQAETAIVAGGCFWCVESDMDHIKGVTGTISGYAGGTMDAPTYENHEGYQEAVKVTFDPAVISYKMLIARFLRTIDVTDDGGQFCDRGESYFTGLYPIGEAQRQAATEALAEAEKSLGQKIVTPIHERTSFFPAEDYHQNYYLGENRVLSRFGIVKQKDAYHDYRKGCGRDERVKQVWGKQAYTDGIGGG